MSRHGYTDDYEGCEGEECEECDPCLWRARVSDAVKAGRPFLRELIDAVEQEDALCENALLALDGQVCAIGAVLKQRGEKVEPEDPEDYSELAPAEIALLAGIPEELAQEVMWQNDEWPAESRKKHVLAWARAHLDPE